MNVMAVTSLILVAVGILLILFGAWMSVREWEKAQAKLLEGKAGAEKASLSESLSSLAKVLEALKTYPAGQRLIVFGIIVLIVAGLFGGISGL